MSLNIPTELNPVLGNRYPHRPRILFVLRKKSSASKEAFEQALTTWRSERPSGVSIGSLSARAGVQVEERQEDVSGRFRPAGVEVTSWDGYVSLDLENFDPKDTDFESLLAASTGALDSLDDVVDRSASLTLFGVANLVIPGGGPYSMLLILDRKDHLSIEEFNDWWIRHGNDHRKAYVGQAGYHQLHIAPEFNKLAAEASGTSTTDLCIIDLMYLADLDDAFANTFEPGGPEAKAMSADVAGNVSMAEVGGSLFREV
ncbi:hypothetical protein [Rhodococcoides yunnanense]|uniref:hypothetical protein n=1 Tax=Rhodococcoides yunnanense TaxID=278209 RepID=UPI0009335BB3|nr:hypothetical protein [Rhodococcus yunnanensis]